MAESSNQNDHTWIKCVTLKMIAVLIIFIAWVKILTNLTFYILVRLINEIHAMEQLFLKMVNIFAFISQLLFFTVCELAILGEPDARSLENKQGLTGISALLFYCVIGYFVAKVKDIFENDWSRSTRAQYSTSQYVKWIAKMLLEWAKTIAVVLCLRDRGITFQFNPLYTTVTFLYYMSTEKLFIELLIKLANCCNFNFFDSMEHLYVPIILNVYVIISAIIFTLCVSFGPQAMYALFASYFLLYLRFKDLYYKYIKTLYVEKQTFASFKSATDKDIQKWDDICAVCLNNMSKAKITPCNHLFHPCCLKQCLRTSLQCPLCKYNFVQ